jgi:Fur family transcriptional regulator, iron response regulator
MHTNLGTSASREGVAAMLRSCGVTPTHQRMEIALVLFARQQHLSADQVLAAVNRRHSKTAKATVYNTLKLFLEKRLIREVIVDPAKVFYDPNTRSHHHIYDVETGELTDIDPAAIKITGLPSLPAGTITEGVDVIVRVRRLESARDDEVAQPD